MNFLVDGWSLMICDGLFSFNIQNIKNMEGMFFGCSSLTALNLSWFSTQNVIDMRYKFSGCSSLISIDISSFNVY